LNDLSDKLRLLRQSRQLTQKELAEQVGVAQPYIAEIESGKKKPSTHVLEKLCDALGCSADFLLGIDVPKGPHKLQETPAGPHGLSEALLQEMAAARVTDDELRLALRLAKVMKDGQPPQ
jgi:transcriptional regulator with XRE-family HTH domain